MLLAKKDGYRSRSAYKLLDINEKFKILGRGMSVLDLGSFPGGWIQVVVQKTSASNDDSQMIVAVDLQNMEYIPDVTFLQCNIESEIDLLRTKLNGKKFDVVLSDMAPSSCGHRQVDHANIINLCERARDIAVECLKPGGSFVTKILQGEYEKEFFQSVKSHFCKVAYCKPKSSRSGSTEMYIVALKFKNHV